MQRLQHFITRIISCGKSVLPVLIQRRQLLQGHLRASKGFTCRVRTLAANLHATSPRNSTRNTPHTHKRGKPSVQTPHIPPQVLGDAQPSSADALLVNIDWRKRGIRTKVGMDGEQVDVNNMRDGGVDSRCMGGDGTHLVQQIRCAAAPLVQKKA